MAQSNRILKYLPFLLIIGVWIGGGCASLPQQNPEASLRERVNDYMKASTEGDWGQAYTFFESTYRKSVSKEQFIQRPRKVRTKGYSIESIEVDPKGESAEVQLALDISFQGYTFPKAPKTQTWIREKGNWYIEASSSSPSSPLPKDP